MKLRAAKWLAMSLVTVSAFVFASASTEAEACCGLFQCLFGWCGGCRSQCSPCGPSMGSCGPSGCSTGSYYGPVVYSGCGLEQLLWSCSPCGIASAGCASGDCSVGSSSTYSSSTTPPAPAPEPNDVWNRKKQQKTYADPQGNSKDSDLGDPGRPAGSSNDNRGFKKARTADDTEASDEQGSLSPASKKNDSSTSKAGRKTTGRSQGERRGRFRYLTGPDDQRRRESRLANRSGAHSGRKLVRGPLKSARIVRLPAYPKSDWLPVEGESKVAQK